MPEIPQIVPVESRNEVFFMKLSQKFFAFFFVTQSLFFQTKSLASPLDFEFSEEVPEDSYKKIVKPIVGPMRFMFIQPAAPTGIIGFEAGIGATGTPIPDEAKNLAVQFLTEGTDFPSYLAIPRVLAQKGIPFGIDLAANFAFIPDSNIVLAGGALQWAVIDGPFPLPSIALRIGHTQLLGLQELKAQTTNIEGLASFGIPPGVSILKPYAGAGVSWAAAESQIETNAVSAEGATLTANIKAQTSWQEIYGILGLQLSLFPLISVTGEMQIAQDQSLFSGKLSVGL
jgi:hypothetical protein